MSLYAWRRAVLAVLTALAMAGMTAPVVASPMSACLDAATVARLTAGESCRASSSGKDARLMLTPAHPEARALGAAIAAEHPDIVVEALFLWRTPHDAKPSDETLAVYNVLRSVGSLEGIEYYSASRKKIRVLYEYSSLVTGPADATPVADTWLAVIPAAPETLYARQKDTTFGDNRYRISLASGTGFVSQASTNLTRMSLGIVPVAAPGDVNVRILVLSVDEGLLFYVASSARAAIVPGVRDTLETSFGNRAEAVYRWFSARLAATWPASR